MVARKLYAKANLSAHALYSVAAAYARTGAPFPRGMGETMGMLLMVVGYLWAAFGALLLVTGIDWGVLFSDAPEAARMAALPAWIFDAVVMMILPGLVAGAVGQILRKN